MQDFAVYNTIENQKIVGATRAEATTPIPTPTNLVGFRSKLNAGGEVPERNKLTVHIRWSAGNPEVLQGAQSHHPCIDHEMFKWRGSEQRGEAITEQSFARLSRMPKVSRLTIPKIKGERSMKWCRSAKDPFQIGEHLVGIEPAAQAGLRL